MRNGVWLARCGRGIAEGGNLEAAQDDASPAALRRKTPEGHGFLLFKCDCVLRRSIPEAHDAGGVPPFYGRAKAAAAAGELTKSAENEIKSSMRRGSVPCADL